MAMILRAILFAALLLMPATMVGGQEAQNAYPTVQPGPDLQFPADHGAHPDYRIEWWYVTGWLTAEDGREIGFQVTFFRNRPTLETGNPSAFASNQIVFAHAALSDPAIGHVLHAERSARQGFGIADFSTEDADLTLRDWSFRRDGEGRFVTTIEAEDFNLDLTLSPTQPIFFQGENGYSRKGPQPDQASYYYSLPHLAVTGTIRSRDDASAVTGEAWMDREWSSDFLMEGAVGWDWVGLNLDDGGALVAFRIRNQQGEAIYAGGSLRRADGGINRLAPGDIAFSTDEEWTSPHTGATYPIAQTLTLQLSDGERRFVLDPLFADQELDGRASGLPVYWEGAVRAEGAKGYLEMTGYASELAF